jgi:hypothetical protein
MTILANLVQRFLPPQISSSSRACANPLCHRAVRTTGVLGKSHDSILLNELWFCSPTCCRSNLRALVATLNPAPRAPYRHRIPLGLLLLSRREVTSEQLQQALARQQANSATSIGECLQQLGVVTEHQVTTAVAAQWGCPTFFSPVPERLDPHFVPAELLLRHEMIPVHWNPHERVLHLGFLSAVNYPALGTVEKVLACRAEPCFLPASEHRRALSRIHKRKSGEMAAFAPGLVPEQITEIVLDYATQTGADEIRTAITTDYIWTRMSVAQPLDLIFELCGRPSAEG